MGLQMQNNHVVVLGGLLHDIGKLIRKAQVNPMARDHTQWGDFWFQEKIYGKLRKVFGEEELQIVRSAIGNHHRDEEYISLADAISTGLRRANLEDEEDGDSSNERLVSIFSQVSISDKPKKKKYHKLSFLGKEKAREIFPIDEKECFSEDYPLLLKSLEKEITSLDFSNVSQYESINSIYFLLWKYAWCVPSIEPDVSLFDHLKTTAAIAGCLCSYHKENDDALLSEKSRAFCLIGGDISGIQTYIFNVLSQRGKVAKRLRARSLFVQLVSEIASHKILHAFDLSLCNLISCAGGNFYILSPNLRDMNKTIKQLRTEFDDWTLSELNAELSISLGTLEVAGEELADFTRTLI